LSKPDLDAAWGIAIVRSVLDGIRPEIGELARYLGVDGDTIADAYFRLSSNGVFKIGRLDRDRDVLNAGDMLAWGYYGGYACGATGLV